VCGTVPARSWASMSPKAFLATLAEAAEHPEPDAHLVHHTLQRARAGLLDHKQLAVVLFQARSAAWDEVRRDGLRAATRVPAMPAYLLNQYSALTGVHTGRFDDGDGPAGTKLASVSLTVGGRMRTFGPCQAVGKAAARQAVRLLAVAELAGLQPPDQWLDTARTSSEWLAVKGEATPISVLDTAQGRQWITPLRWHDGKTDAGSPEARVTCKHRGSAVSATGEGGNLKQARQTAAGALILMLNERARTEITETRLAVPAPVDGDRRRAESDATAAPASPPVAAAAPQSPACPPAEAVTAPVEQASAHPAGGGGHLTIRTMLAGLDRDTIRAELGAGTCLVFDTSASTADAGLLCVLGDDTRAAPEATVRRTLVGGQGETFTFRCGRIGTGDAIALLATPPQDEWSGSARVWANVVRLALEAIAQHGITPALAHTTRRGVRYPTWRVGSLDTSQLEMVNHLATELEASPYVLGDWMRGDNVRESINLIRAVRGMIDAVADYLVTSSGRRHLHGPVPFTGAAYLHEADRITALQRWVDDAEGPDEEPAAQQPSLQLTIKPPQPDTTVLETTLQLCRIPGSTDTAVDAEAVWWDGVVLTGFPHGPDLREHVRKRLRLGGRTVPSLEALGADPYPARCWLSAEDAAALRGSAADTLADLGIEVSWDKAWADALSVEAVVGPALPTGPLTGRLGLGELFDRRWRVTADGQILGPAELDRLRRAELPWIMRKNRWIMIDDVTRECLRQPKVTTIPRAQGMLEVLDGWVTIKGRVYACKPADGLAAVIADLRSTDYAEAIRQVDAECSITLLPHQSRAVAWMIRMSQAGFGCLLADDMGLGKTISALAFHQSRRRAAADLPTLVVCLNSNLIGQWEEEIARHTGLPVMVFWNQQRSLAGLTADTIVLTTYGTLPGSIDELSAVRWGVVIADEAQRTKNGATGAARWIRALPSAMRVALTGTPLENQPGELRTILDWCNPGLFGTQAEFNAQFVRPITDAEDERQAEQARQRIHRVLRPFLLRRLKDDPALGLNLPGKHETTHIVHLSDRQRGMLEALTADDVEQIERNPHSPATGTLAKKVIHDQRKITNSPAQYTEVPLDELGLDPHELEHDTPKLTRLRQLLEPLRDTDERALVFTHYVYAAKMVDYFVTRLGYKSSLYIGEVGEADREDRIDAFTTGDTQILVATVTTAGVGLDLSRANHVIHFERHWNPAVEAQANDRAYRIGQTRTVRINYLVTRNSIEDRIAALLANKRDQSALYLPGGEFDFTKLTAAELVQLVKLRTS
jgi:superfamily II DNA or RNA helicase